MTLSPEVSVCEFSYTHMCFTENRKLADYFSYWLIQSGMQNLAMSKVKARIQFHSRHPSRLFDMNKMWFWVVGEGITPVGQRKWHLLVQQYDPGQELVPSSCRAQPVPLWIWLLDCYSLARAHFLFSMELSFIAVLNYSHTKRISRGHVDKSENKQKMVTSNSRVLYIEVSLF